MTNAFTARAAALPFVAACITFATAAHASPADYVYSPTVEQGEKEIDFKFGSAKARDGTRESATSIGFGYGVNAWWFTEAYAKANRASPGQWRFDAVEWENKFQLTETGKYPVDLGLIVEMERPQDRSEGWELRFGPLFQAELTPSVVGNVNLLFGRQYRSETPSPMSMEYQWQLRYRWKPEFEVGAQGFGALGPWRDWSPSSEQEHKAGPAIFGKFKLAGRQAIRYNAAWLIGTNSNTPRNTLRLQTEFEF
ncbi:MAG: hypothetical protein JWQ33_2375 [Ramlibacter sp.]|nr:hypothetical protein [Ramlibacter sp.]